MNQTFNDLNIWKQFYLLDMTQNGFYCHVFIVVLTWIILSPLLLLSCCWVYYCDLLIWGYIHLMLTYTSYSSTWSPAIVHLDKVLMLFSYIAHKRAHTKLCENPRSSAKDMALVSEEMSGSELGHFFTMNYSQAPASNFFVWLISFGDEPWWVTCKANCPTPLYYLSDPAPF